MIITEAYNSILFENFKLGDMITKDQQQQLKKVAEKYKYVTGTGKEQKLAQKVVSGAVGAVTNELSKKDKEITKSEIKNKQKNIPKDIMFIRDGFLKFINSKLNKVLITLNGAFKLMDCLDRKIGVKIIEVVKKQKQFNRGRRVIIKIVPRESKNDYNGLIFVHVDDAFYRVDYRLFVEKDELDKFELIDEIILVKHNNSWYIENVKCRSGKELSEYRPSQSEIEAAERKYKKAMKKKEKKKKVSQQKQNKTKEQKKVKVATGGSGSSGGGSGDNNPPVTPTESKSFIKRIIEKLKNLATQGSFIGLILSVAGLLVIYVYSKKANIKFKPWSLRFWKELFVSLKPWSKLIKTIVYTAVFTMLIGFILTGIKLFRMIWGFVSRIRRI